MNRPHVVIVGSGPAGLRTAEALRARGSTARITLLGDEPHPCYHRPALSKELLTRDDRPTQPPLVREDFADLNLDLRLGVAAVRLDPLTRTLELADGCDLVWDRLVIATGVRAAVPARWAGDERIHTLRTFADLRRLRAALRDARRVAVVGAGVLGCEIAAAARQRGADVDLVDVAATPMQRMIGPEVGRFVAALHEKHGVTLRLGRRVASLDPDLVLDDGAACAADAVVVAIGADAELNWLAGSGIEVDGGVVVDEHGESSVPGIFAAGDVAVTRSGVGRPVRQEHWTHATESAEVVAANLFCPVRERTRLDALPYAWSDQWGVKMQTLGRSTDTFVLGERDAERQRLFGVYVEDGHVVGAVGWNRVPLLMRSRRPLIERWSVETTLDHLGLTDAVRSAPALV